MGDTQTRATRHTRAHGQRAPPPTRYVGAEVQERLLQPAGAVAGGAGQGNPDVDATVYAHLAEYATSLDIGRGQASSFHRPASAVGCGCDLLFYFCRRGACLCLSMCVCVPAYCVVPGVTCSVT